MVDGLGSYFFIFPSLQRFFIASDSRLLPSGVSPPRLRFFVVLPLGLLTRFLLPGDEADPRRALTARLRRSRSFAKSETNFARSKVVRSFLIASVLSLSRRDTVYCFGEPACTHHLLRP